MKWMISVPMRNRKNSEIRKDILRAKKKIRLYDKDAVILTPILVKYFRPLDGLAKGISDMAQVDAVFFCDNCMEYRGCLVECIIAKLYEKRVYFE